MQSKRFIRLLKEGGWVFFGQITLVLGTYAFIRYLTELISPEDYGQLALAITIATLVNQTSFGPLSGGLMRFYAPAAEKGELASYFSATKKLTLLFFIAVIPLASVSLLVLNIFDKTEFISIFIMTLSFALLSSLSVCMTAIKSASRARVFVALSQSSEPLLRILLVTVVIFYCNKNTLSVMIGYVLTCLVILSCQIVYFKPSYNKKEIDHKSVLSWQKKIWNFSWPFSIFGLFTWTHLASDRWALQVFTSMHDVGIYAVIYQLGYYPMSIISGVMMQFFVPILYAWAGDASEDERNKKVSNLNWNVVSATLVITLVASLLAFFCHEYILSILVAIEYRNFSGLLPWMILSGGVFAAGQSLAAGLLAQLKVREMMIAKIITAIIGVIFNIVGSYVLGLQGVVAANLLFSIIFFIWMTTLTKRID